MFIFQCCQVSFPRSGRDWQHCRHFHRRRPAEHDDDSCRGWMPLCGRISESHFAAKIKSSRNQSLQVLRYCKFFRVLIISK